MESGSSSKDVPKTKPPMKPSKTATKALETAKKATTLKTGTTAVKETSIETSTETEESEAVSWDN